MKKITLTQIILGIVAVLVIVGLAFARFTQGQKDIIANGSYPESGNEIINYNAYPKSAIYQKGDAQFEKLASRTSDHYDGTSKKVGEVTDGYQCVNALKRFVTKNTSTNPVTSETYNVSGIGVSFELNGDTVPEGFVEVLKSMKGIDAYDASAEYNIPAV